MSTIPVTFYRAATYTEGRTAEIDPHEYVEWCHENGHDSTDLDVLQNYVLNEYCGDFEELEGDYEESEFRQFDDAGYANWLTTAALVTERTMRPSEELRRIARGEVHRYGTRGRGIEVLQADRGLTEAEARHVIDLMRNAQITLPA